MTLILTAVALVLVFEGLVFALAPNRLEQALVWLTSLPVDTRRMMGLATVSEAQTTRRTPADGAVAVAPADGEALVRMMRARYAGRWYKTLTFVQKTTAYDAQGAILKSVDFKPD